MQGGNRLRLKASPIARGLSVSLVGLLFAGTWAANAGGTSRPLPRVWMSIYGKGDRNEIFRMCAAQGVDCVAVGTGSQDECAKVLEMLRHHGLKGFTASGPDVSMNSRPADGGLCERAVCTGGAYRGLSIDRNLFSFTAGPHEIIVEPPVSDGGQPSALTINNPDGSSRTVRGGHYFGGLRPTGVAEVVVPERLYDGAQHLRVIPCEVLPANQGDVPEKDTAAGMSGPEIENRRLVRLKFDLSGCEGCLLDKVGIAVYWESDPDGDPWKKGYGQISVFADSTRQSARHNGHKIAERWRAANGGAFPSNDIVAIRFGDETFNIARWAPTPACSYPLWGFSESGRAAFAAAAPGLAQPRTFGCPEIYGPVAGAVALYEFHRACANLVRAFREGVREVTPHLLVFRNTTRGPAWAQCNDMDGSGQELLARELDFIHLDPYPIGARGYNNDTIPGDMGYVAGLARRFGKPLVPWMQAHSYTPGGSDYLTHPTPADMRRMWEQHKPFTPAAIIWLEFRLANTSGMASQATFPYGAPESWAAAKDLHAEIHAMGSAPARATERAPLAIVRPYSTRAACCYLSDGRWRNPADRHLEAYALAWGVDNGLQYDIFELPPNITNGTGPSPELIEELSRYPRVVSTIPIPGLPNVRVLGAGTEGTVMTQEEFNTLRKNFAREIAVGVAKAPRKRVL